MTGRRNIAIIGCGMMGREHMRNIALVPKFELVAVADLDAGSRDMAAQLAVSLGQQPSMFKNGSALMQEVQPEAVIIASPNHTHFEVLGEVMPYEVALLVEKPLCTTVEHAKQIAQFAANYPALFWVGLEYRFMPPITRFIERVHAGETGDMKMLYIREHIKTDISPIHKPTKRTAQLHWLVVFHAASGAFALFTP